MKQTPPQHAVQSPACRWATSCGSPARRAAASKTGEYPKDFAEEVHSTFKRIEMILTDAGYTFDDVVDAKVYLTDIATFSTMSGIFREYFKKDPPARTTVGIASLVGKARIEITVTAAK